MYDNFDYEEFRDGSARPATLEDTHRAGITGQALYGASGPYFGDHHGWPMHNQSDGPMLLCGGAGSGKMASAGIAVNACLSTEKYAFLDPRGEIACVAIDNAVRMGMAAYVVNLFGLHGLPQHTIGLTAHLKTGSAFLNSDIKIACADLIVCDGTDGDQYFEDVARRWAEALMVYDAHKHGSVFLLRIYQYIGIILSKSDNWKSLAKDMVQIAPETATVVKEILSHQTGDGRTYDAVMSVINNALAWMSDPAVRAALSDKPDLDLEEFVRMKKPARLFIAIPAETLQILSPLVRLLFGSLITIKSRYPQAPRLNLCVDEAGQLQKAEFILRGFSYARGAGVRIQAVYQSLGQIERYFGKAGAVSIISSAVIRQFIGTRDIDTAATISRMCGNMTLSYKSEARQGHAQQEYRRAFYDAFIQGGDFMRTMMEAAHWRRTADTPDKKARALITPDEVLNAPEMANLVFVSGKDCPPIFGDRKNYWERQDMAGMYFENPFHIPLGRVQIRGRFGPEWRRVIEANVPSQFAHLPQFKCGRPLRYVEGFRPY